MLPPAEQPVDRLVQQPAGQVPERDVHRGDADAGILALGALDLVVDELALQRVAALEERPQARDDRDVHRLDPGTGTRDAGVAVDHQDRPAGLQARPRDVYLVKHVVVGSQLTLLVGEVDQLQGGDDGICHGPHPAYSKAGTPRTPGTARNSDPASG